MANLLNVALIESIQTLFAQGWTRRRIARELGIDRATVRKYVQCGAYGPKPAHAPSGSEGSKPATSAGLPGPESKPANLPIGSIAPPGPPSQCEPHRELILAKVAEGLTAQRIQQDLAVEGIALGYDSVRRFVRRLGRQRALPFRRLECAAGEEAQVDFGSGAYVIAPTDAAGNVPQRRKRTPPPLGSESARRPIGV